MACCYHGVFESVSHGSPCIVCVNTTRKCVFSFHIQDCMYPSLTCVTEPEVYNVYVHMHLCHPTAGASSGVLQQYSSYMYCTILHLHTQYCIVL